MNLSTSFPFSEFEVYRAYSLILDEADARRLARQTAEAFAFIAKAQSECAPARMNGSVIVEAQLSGGAVSTDLLVALSMLDEDLRLRVERHLGPALANTSFAGYWEARVREVEQVVQERQQQSSPGDSA